MDITAKKKKKRKKICCIEFMIMVYKLQEISMLYYNVRKFRPGHYKSHALISPNSHVSEKKNSHRNEVAFEFCFFSNFFRLFDRKLHFIGLSAKKTYFNGIFQKGHAIL